jgi:prophage tail gpP-like protein
MTEQEDLILVVEGERYRGWQRIRVSRSIERGAHSFDLTLTQDLDKGKIRPVKAGQAATVLIDNDLVVTGYIDSVKPNYDAKSYTIQVSGRSKVGDLIDCSSQRKQYKGQTLLDIAKAECEPFGIKVTADVDVGAPFSHTPTRDAGESVFEFIEQLARYRGVRLMSDAKGDLLLTRAGTKRTQVALKLGDNILSAKGDFSHLDLFSEYTVLAQQPAADFSLDAEAISAPSHTLKDDRIKRYRPRVIHSQQPGNAQDCKVRAEWQRNTQYGNSRGVVYTVNGWRQKPNGRLWDVNELVPVEDHFQSISGDRLIAEVQLIIDDKGQRTELKVMPKEAFDLVPLPEPKAEDDGWLN